MLRYMIANVTVEQVAKMGQDAGISGTVYASTGFGNWGIESGVTVELGDLCSTKANDFIASILTKYGEQYAYRIVENGEGKLLSSQGEIL